MSDPFDGERAVVSRYATHGHKAPTLYYRSGSQYVCREGTCVMLNGSRHETVIVASEPHFKMHAAQLALAESYEALGRPSDAAAIPFPSEETTPPVTKMNLVGVEVVSVIELIE